MINNVYKIYKYFLFLANISAFAVGTCLGWTSPIAGKLKSGEDSPLSEKITSSEDAWISSIVALGALVGRSLKIEKYFFSY